MDTAKRLLVKLVAVAVMVTGVLVGTPTAASADVCIYIWTMSPKPIPICLWWAAR
ncbi:MAG: hypothetical protein ACRDKJ_12175 [Actinomycetota bacterium]